MTSYSTGLPIRASPANLGQDKSRSFSAVLRSTHTDENTQVPDRTSQFSQFGTMLLRAPKRIYKFRTRQDKQASRLGPAFAHTDENTQVQEMSVKLLDRSPDPSTGESWSGQLSQAVSRLSRDPRTPMRIHKSRIGQANLLNSVPCFCVPKRIYKLRTR